MKQRYAIVGCSLMHAPPSVEKKKKRKQIPHSDIFADLSVFITLKTHRFRVQQVIIKCMLHEKIVTDFLSHMKAPKSNKYRNFSSIRADLNHYFFETAVTPLQSTKSRHIYTGNE